MPESNDLLLARLLRALNFAAEKHRDQRRKGFEGAPYVNHLIEVCEILARVGITDPVTLQAAALHDTLEDTDTTREHLQDEFGDEIVRVVEEVTDDRDLPKQERKALQIVHAPALSPAAKLIKIADKVSNIRGIIFAPPKDWSVQQRREYLEWTARVVAGCRGVHPELERLYDEVLEEGRRILQP